MFKKNSGAMKAAYAILLAIIITGAVVGAGVWYFTRPPASADVVEVYHWWTSGGEAAAINAFVNVFQNRYNVTVIQSPVAGGAGYVFRSVIKPLVIAGEAPDAFQVHAGYEMKPYVDGGYLDSINDFWSSQGFDTVFPAVVKDMVNFGGNYYGVPLDIHRANVVWYNKHILDANNITYPITTWDAFFAACDKLSQNATLMSDSKFSVISLGDQGPWTAAHVLEQIMASEGIGFYQDFINGNVTDASNTMLRDALTKFTKYLNYTNANHATLTWDGATALIISNESAFNIMGDWANGEFLKAGATYNTDYGTFPVPGTSNMYALVLDCFEHPKGVKHPANSLLWLTEVGSKEGQNTFNPLKGSIAARNDLTAADKALYGPYQQTALNDFGTVTYMYPSIVHGSAMPQSFTTPLSDMISALVTGSYHKDSSAAINAAATSLTQTITNNIGDFTKVWTLH